MCSFLLVVIYHNFANSISNSFNLQPFTIHIRNTNDPPEDIILPVTEVPESHPSGTALGSIRVIDQDRNEHHSCVVENQQPPDALRIDYSTVLVINSAFWIDYERYQDINVTVSCTDGFLSIRRQFTLAILDDEDSLSIDVTYTKYVSEGLSTGSTVTSIIVRNSDDPTMAPYVFPDIFIALPPRLSTDEEPIFGVRPNRNRTMVYEVFVLDGDRLSHEANNVLLMPVLIMVISQHGILNFNYTLMFNVSIRTHVFNIQLFHILK